MTATRCPRYCSSAPVRLPLALALAITAFGAVNSAKAAPAKGSISVGGDAKAEKKPDEGTPWIKRYAPNRHMGEFGIYGGIYLPSRGHELFEADRRLPDQGYNDFDTVMGDFGLRAGYFPLRFFGVELEGGLMPGRTKDDVRATIYTFRGHVVGQVGLWRVVPFALAGVSALGVRSVRSAVGNDVDLAVHVGVGAKLYINRWFGVRLDLRNVIAAERGVSDGASQNGEILFGLVFSFGRDKPKQEGPKDRDGDGFLDHLDRCPDDPGVAPDGCPVGDRDGDGFLDPDDRCPDEPGTEPDGCPVGDRDGDGFLDPDDACPDERGVAPDGCPDLDKDDDGILDDDDDCPEKPENKNGFEDDDGCPDEVPEEVKEFLGVIEGIFFALDRDVVRRKSRPTLDKAVQVLKDFPKVRLEIVGHTDSTGKAAHNEDLSARRAKAVKQYLVDNGIDESRLKTRGAGSAEPIADNKTDKGRAKNRRIEFKILEQ